jgi:hypothetical protein
VLTFKGDTPVEMEGIKKANGSIRILGVHFDRDGVVNNLDNTIQDIILTLSSLKTRYLNFSTRVNCFKSYGIGKIYYLAPFIVPTEKQIQLIENLEKWFLFDDKHPVFDSQRKVNAKSR